MEVDYNYLYGTFRRFIVTGDSGASFVFTILFFWVLNGTTLSKLQQKYYVLVNYSFNFQRPFMRMHIFVPYS